MLISTIRSQYRTSIHSKLLGVGGLGTIALVTMAPAAAEIISTQSTEFETSSVRGETPDEISADDIIVSANRKQQARAEVGSAVSVISDVEIETAQYQFVSDALGRSPGVSLARNSAFGGVSSVNIRGSSSRQTLVVLDGIVINDPSGPGGGFNFANLDVADIDRIEVLRGPQSILYGTEAIGGVISISTKRGVNDPSFSAFAEGGSFGTARAGAGISGDTGTFDYRLSVFGIRTNGISRADEDDGNTERDGYRSIAGSANVGLQVTDTIRLETFLRYGTSALEFDGFPPPNFSLADSDDNDSTEELALAGRIIANLLDERFTNQLTVSYSDIERNNFAGDVPTFGAQGNRFAIDYLGTLNLHQKVDLTFGVKSEQTDIDTGTITDNVRVNSGFALLEIGLIDTTSQSLTVTGGVRHDDHETFGGVTTARITGAYVMNDLGLILRGSWGEAFSAPSLFQLNATFGPGPANRDLAPEESTGWDIGVEKSLFGERSRLAVTWFNQNTENLIDFNFATGAFFNIDQTRQRGLEAEFQIQLMDALKFDSAYTFTDAIDQTTDMAILRQPHHRLVSNIDWQASDALGLSLGITYNGSESDVGGPNEAFTRIDLRGRYTLSDRLELFARIENLTDANYQDIRGFGEPGLSLFGGLRVRL